jgi:hypothetical protein
MQHEATAMTATPLLLNQDALAILRWQDDGGPNVPASGTDDAFGDPPFGEAPSEWEDPPITSNHPPPGEVPVLDITPGLSLVTAPSVAMVGVELQPVFTPPRTGQQHLIPALAARQNKQDSSLNCKKAPASHNGNSVYGALADHQLAENSWRYGPVIQELHRWRVLFEDEFRLGLPEVAFCVGFTRLRCHGYFRPGHNWYGFTREILLNERHVLQCIEENEFWQVIGTELHELLHAWQDEHGTAGRNNYHNAQFRDKARRLGLVVDSRGCTDFDPEGPFCQLIQKYGVADLAMPEGVRPYVAGSKLHKWVCGCHPQYGVRVAIEDFDAWCGRCGEKFFRPDCEQLGGQPEQSK